MSDEHDYDFDRNRRTDRTSISRRFPDSEKRPMRIASTVVAPDEDHHFALEKEELIIRVTPGKRQYIKATFYEDSRNIQTLEFHRYTTATGHPHKTYFSFGANETHRIIEFLLSIKTHHLANSGKLTIPNEQLREALLSSEQVSHFLREHPEFAAQIVRDEITTEDVVAIGYRRKQLNLFKQLLSDPKAFIAERERIGANRDEDVWQKFFEANSWIFGYGLQYIFTTGLDDSKLERWIQGHDLTHRGKRADAVMKTRGILSSLCLIEIKKHDTPLLAEGQPYRAGCWAPHKEVSGGVAQLQTTVRTAFDAQSDKITLTDKHGNPSGETVYNHQPRAFLVVGTLDQFISEHGVNEEKLRSFELYRANITQPTIITFDELFERAKFIVESA